MQFTQPVASTRMVARASAIAIATFLAGLIGGCGTASPHRVKVRLAAREDVDISARSSNGYKLTISVRRFLASRKEVQGPRTSFGLTAERNGASADYVTAARLSADDAVRARLGKLGRVAVRFEPTKLEKPGPGHGCRGDSVVTKHGVFKGTIRFHGEGGYTRLNIRRIKGLITVFPERICRLPVAPGSSRATRLVATAHRGHSTIGFAASKSSAQARATFDAGTTERRGRVLIERSVSSNGPASAFAFDSALTSATVLPGAPFQGDASYQASANGDSGTWLGPLSVSFPGRPHTRLAGRDFEASLKVGSQSQSDSDSVVTTSRRAAILQRAMAAGERS